MGRKSLGLAHRKERIKKYRSSERYKEITKKQRERISPDGTTRTQRYKATEKYRIMSTRLAKKYRYKKYGITEEIYKKIKSEQNGVCCVCGEKNTYSRNLVIDHDHETGKIRGLLCTLCNLSLGNARDNLYIVLKLADYAMERF